MTRPSDHRARQGYRLFLRAFPEPFRARNGAEMEETFLALLRADEARYGALGRVRIWIGGAWDAAVRGLAFRMRLAWRRHGFGTGGDLGAGAARGGGGGAWNDGTGVRHKTGIVDMMGSVWGDVRFAVRALARRPLFALTVVATLALGIGANASVFTVVDGFLFTPLPYEEPEELVTIWSENPVLGWERTDVSPANAWDWRQRARSLEDLAVYYSDALNLTGDGPPELVNGLRVTPNMLHLLGRSPVLGRDLTPEEVGEDRDDVVILSHGFWERRFGADRTVLGSSINLDGQPRTVVGVMAADFRFLDTPFDVLMPQDLRPEEAERNGHYAEAIARLAEGVTLDQARSELRGIAAQLEAEYPDTNENWTVSVVSTHAEMVGPVARQASIVLLAAVGFVLLMVCVNVANLLLARGGSRTRELAVRAALGAGRGRVVRQLLTESLVLAVAGGGGGFLLSLWGYRAIVAALPSEMPPVFQFGLDGSVIGFTVGVTVLAALLFGAVPAFKSSAGGADTLRDGGRGGQSRAAARFGSVLVVLQTAMAVVLLVGGTLLMKSIAGMRAQDFGFDPTNVITARIAPPSAAYPGQEDLRVFWDRVLTEVGSLPEVTAAGLTQSHPLMGSNWGRSLRLAGQDVERTARLTYASEGWFDALRVRLLAGRTLKDSDATDAPVVAVVNETFVTRYLGEGADPLGASFLQDPDTLPPVPIVGVIADLVERGVDKPPEPSVYLSVRQANLRTLSLVLRTAGPPQDAMPQVQAAVWAVDPDLPLFQIETMEALIHRRIGGFAVIGYLMGIFALLSLVLGAVGIYGVTAYASGQRTSEIGVRLAMGARRRDVVRMVVGQGARRAALGLILGLGLAVLVAGALRGVLVGVNPRDPSTFVAVTVVLAAVSFLGLWLPARKASAVDPMSALSSE